MDTKQVTVINRRSIPRRLPEGVLSSYVIPSGPGVRQFDYGLLRYNSSYDPFFYDESSVVRCEFPWGWYALGNNKTIGVNYSYSTISCLFFIFCMRNFFIFYLRLALLPIN